MAARRKQQQREREGSESKREMSPLLRGLIVGIGRIGARGGAQFVHSVTKDVGDVVSAAREKLKDVEANLEDFYSAMGGTQKKNNDDDDGQR